MLKLYDLVCSSCDAVWEGYVKQFGCSLPCPCGGIATTQLSPVRIDRTRIATTEGASPESIAHFDRIHRQRKAIEDKTFAEHGDYGKAAGSD